MIFRTPKEMRNHIINHDIWSPDLELYVFSNNDEHSVAVCEITEDEANYLSNIAKINKEQWSAYLSTEGQILDMAEYNKSHPSEYNDYFGDVLDFCNEYFQYEWINCKDY